MKAKNQGNYLDFIPVKNPEIEYQTGDDGTVTLFIEWKGFYHRIAQKFFHRPRVSDIRLDDYGSFVWLSIDDSKDVHQDFQRTECQISRHWKNPSPGLSNFWRFFEITI